MGQRNGASGQPPEPIVSLYANYVEVAYTPFEFVFDFGQSYAKGQTSCHTRIVTSPFYARALLETLLKSFEEYQQHFGSDERK